MKLNTNESPLPPSPRALAAMQAAHCAECLIWAKEDGVVREVIDAGHAPQAGFVLMNQTAEARQRGMHKLGRMPVRCVLRVCVLVACVEQPPLCRVRRRWRHTGGWWTPRW